MNRKQINLLIAPFQIFYDSQTKRNYFFNTEKGTSNWKLPQDKHQDFLNYINSIKKQLPKDQPTKNIYKFLPRQYVNKEKRKYLQLNDQNVLRQARKQLQTSLATTYAYKDGDQQYNIWYNKYINDKPKEIRQAALTRCNPQLDIGYTKANLLHPDNSYFCLHFSKGCCSLGVSCNYFHRLPNIADCQRIDNSRDIFGRKRFSSYKQNMGGVGNFNKDTSALYIHDYVLPNSQQPLNDMYQILFRHFSQWTQVEDINIIAAKGYAFIKLSHRCMAQFVKQAMHHQALDMNEIITIKWANEDPNPQKVKVQQREQKRVLLKAMQKKAEQLRKERVRQSIKESRQKFLKGLRNSSK